MENLLEEIKNSRIHTLYLDIVTKESSGLTIVELSELAEFLNQNER